MKLTKTVKTDRRAAILSYTKTGHALAERICDLLTDVEEVRFYAHKRDFLKTADVLDIEFPRADLIIFVSAAGIAVRQLAPYLKSKAEDPAVLVIDERALHVIALLSGHLGGANARCRSLAALLGADPVITTATDLEACFAVDLFAKQNGFWMEDIRSIKEVSSRLLSGKEVAVRIDDAALAERLKMMELPQGLIPAGCRKTDCTIEIVTKAAAQPAGGETVCRLYADNLYLGIGCRKDKEAEAIKKAVDTVLTQYGIAEERLKGIGSIDLKKDEAGIHALARERGLRFVTFSAEELNRVPGSFTASEFVKQTTGTDSVSERSALYLAGEGAELIVPKTAMDGVTVAIAAAPVSIRFEETAEQ